MLTEILIKPFIEDLKHEGIEDTTPYEQGFMAGMAALSDILSENMDNQPQLFTYLGMAISEGMQWVESQVSESPEKAPVFPGTNEFIPQLHDPRWVEPSDDLVGFDCYGLANFNTVCKGVLNRTAEGAFYIYQYGGYEFGVNKVILLESPNNPRERQPIPSSDQELEFDFIPSFDTPADFVSKYKSQTVFYKQMEDLSIERVGQMVLDLSQSELILIDTMTSNQVKKPYYVRLK